MYLKDGLWLPNDFMVDPIPLALTFAQEILTEQQHCILSNTIKRCPILAESECERFITGADSFTPDSRLIMNESVEIDNYFVASGSNGHSIALAGGVGKYIAELIHNGNTNLSTWSVDIRRFMRLHTNERFLQDRLREIPGKQYSLKYPAYGEVLGYERPIFFKTDEAGKSTFGKARWFNTVKKEYNACRKSIAVIDMTSFTIYKLESANQSVVDFLQMFYANNIDKPIGTVVHTGIFLLASPTSQSTRNMKWLKTHVPEDTSIFLSDVTSLYTALDVIGPKAKYLLSQLSDEHFNDFTRLN
ncbi:unnamed protein product [Adineta steineri]|uniref:Uncharacterized protein n=1 Tax=Adineta steineri TaxID=433720 RepID=A0A814LQE1_9BILA|nr:unnamed protein product [Adineta steineri]CAF1416077.1 unnamed protein product [Adineta steineri]CAF1437515.1 unnamed protein product [Adineta steineri]